MTNQNGQTRTKAKKTEKKESLAENDPVPEDVHWEWIELVKALQAACRTNNGFGKLTVELSVHLNKPVLWAPPEIVDIDPNQIQLPQYKLLRLSPRRVAEYRMTSSTVATLMSLHEK